MKVSLKKVASLTCHRGQNRRRFSARYSDADGPYGQHYLDTYICKFT